MKREDVKIKCPNCQEVQAEDIHDLVDPGDMEGQMELECHACRESFLVKYEYRAFIEEVTSE